MPKEKKPVKIVVYDDYCKGCEICVEVCEPKTLFMRGLYAAVGDLDSCTKCMLCELRCPDFAIYVY